MCRTAARVASDGKRTWCRLGGRKERNEVGCPQASLTDLSRRFNESNRALWAEQIAKEGLDAAQLGFAERKVTSSSEVRLEAVGEDLLVRDGEAVRCVVGIVLEYSAKTVCPGEVRESPVRDDEASQSLRKLR